MKPGHRWRMGKVGSKGKGIKGQLNQTINGVNVNVGKLFQKRVDVLKGGVIAIAGQKQKARKNGERVRAKRGARYSAKRTPRDVWVWVGVCPCKSAGR